ncbi:MAG: 16S rRNA (uracil(1498)-N(3))-methyltransferase [Synergistaceae bacterium]|nr:16S rRNA (uracil(1498)-N(3))-methyltransferase [Synergistaceae bacterium]
MSWPKIRLELCSRADGDDLWRLDEAQARHLVKSMRACEGAMVEGLLPEGEGRRFLMRLEKGEGCFLLRTVDAEGEVREVVAITLMIGLLKSDQFEFVLRAAPELGVHCVLPVVCERSVPRLGDETEIRKKMSRWLRILSEATKISGSVFIPALAEPVKFHDVEWNAMPERRYAALLGNEAVPLSDVPAGDGGIVFAVGPEGDWTAAEASELIDRGFTPVSLGRRIMRSSTAATVGAAWFRLSNSNFESNKRILGQN